MGLGLASDRLAKTPDLMPGDVTGSLVYDARTAGLGRMNPGESRAYSVRFNQFDDINRIDRYEAAVAFQR